MLKIHAWGAVATAVLFAVIIATSAASLIPPNVNPPRQTCLKELQIDAPRGSTVINSSDPSGDEWPMFRGQLNNIGVAVTTPRSASEPFWVNGGSFYSAAVVDGKVYLSSVLHSILCIDATTGTKIWNYSTSWDGDSSPAVSNGRVFASAGDFYCLNALTGSQIWEISLGINCSSPAVSNNCVYIGSTDKKLYCLDAQTGAVNWSFDTGVEVKSSPAVVNAKVYIGGTNVTCLNAINGSPIWNYTVAGLAETSPAVVGGRVFVGCNDSKLYCLDAQTGLSIWNFTTGNAIYSSPAVAGGRVYVGSRDHCLYCLDALTGSQVWTFATNDSVDISPAVACNLVYVGGNNGYIYCLNGSTGTLAWSYYTNYPIVSSPAIANGSLFTNGWGLIGVINRLPMLLVPSPPLQLFAQNGTKQVTLQWKVPSTIGGSTIIRYNIYRGNAAGNETLIASVGNILNYTDTGLTPGQAYYYTISATNGAGESLESAEVSAKPADTPDAPLFDAFSGGLIGAGAGVLAGIIITTMAFKHKGKKPAPPDDTSIDDLY